VTEYQYLAQELQKDIEARAQSVAAGNCQTYEEYRHTAGIIRGLALAVDFIKDREQKVKDSDE
jgi:hypothetical protein